MKTTGYKAMNKNMKCRAFQFEVGKTYTIENDEPLRLCSDTGFHFCKNLEDVFRHYDYDDCRLFEVESESEVLTEYDKSITKRITIKRELTKEELSQHNFEQEYLNIFFSNMSDEELIKFKDNKDWFIRKTVINKMTDLNLMFNTFKDDKDFRVRLAVIQKMEDLELMHKTFKNDKDYGIRFEVVYKMKDLDLMFNTFKDDEDWSVREAVVRRMEDLNLMCKTFKFDESWIVRQAVIIKMERSDLMRKTFKLKMLKICHFFLLIKS